MKSYCKRTFFDKDNSVKWIKEKYYDTMVPDDYELKNGVHVYVKVEDRHQMYHPLNKNEYNKYFIGIDEIREEKIKQILG